MLNKILHFLIYSLFILVPILHSHLFDVFGLENIWEYFYINWNYELFKVLFFNIVSWTIFTLFILKYFIDKNIDKIRFPRYSIILIIILLLSLFFSETFYTSLFWNIDKWHWIIFFLNLLFLNIVLINIISKNNINNVIKSIILWWFIVSLISIKEFIFPSFDYSDLSNRAIWTLWHPNYLALYLLLIIPILNNKINSFKENYLLSLFLFFILIALFLTKSVWAIFLFFNYILYLKFNYIKEKTNKILSIKNTHIFLLLSYLSLLIITFFIILNLYPEKLTSFVSRFYIWATTLKVILSDFSNLIFWNSLWNLWYYFEEFKVKELYIFENFWYIADRPHNIFISIFYSFWLAWLILLIFWIKLLYTNFNKIKYEATIIILFLLFNLLNFPTVSSYLILIFIISLAYINTNKYNNVVLNKLSIASIFLLSITFIVINWVYFKQENTKYLDSFNKSKPSISSIIQNENKEIQILNKNIFEEEKCKELIKNSSSVENYFYCWNLLHIKNIELAKNYYSLWLKKLPDLRIENSKYYNGIFINKNNVKHRFFSEKYSNILQILDRLWDKK